MDSRDDGAGDNDEEGLLPGLKIGSYVHVRLPTRFSHKNYVAQIIHLDSDEISVSYLRKSKLSSHTFVEPPREDVSAIDKTWIFKISSEPVLDRRGGKMIENIDKSILWE